MTERFIKLVTNKVMKWILNPWQRVRLLHDKLLQTDVSNFMDAEEFRNPYHAFSEWLLEILSYGAVILVVYWWLTGSLARWWLVLPAAGMLRWLVLDFVGEIVRRIKK